MPGAPTRFVVESRESRHRPHGKVLACVIGILGVALAWDPAVRHGGVWVLAGLAIFVAIIEHYGGASSDGIVESVVEIGPLGIQRSSSSSSRGRLPLLPRACVRDCLLVEKVGAFGVATRLVFRLHPTNEGTTSTRLVPVFPGADLSFEQCHSLRRKMQRALDET